MHLDKVEEPNTTNPSSKVISRPDETLNLSAADAAETN